MSDTTPNRIALIGEQIRTQDNSSTADPLFVVYQKRRIYGMDPEYVNPVTWLHCDGDEANEQQAKDLEADYNKTLEEPDDWTRTGYVDIDVFCTACLTRKGCEEYLDAYGHNLDRPFIDVDTLRRNEEMIAVRDCLGVATPEPVAVLSAVSPSKTTEDDASITNAEADAAYAEFDAKMKAKKRTETRMTIKNAALITNAGIFSGAIITAEGECITQRGERYVRVYQPASIPHVHVRLPGECYVRIYDPSAALSELFTNAIGVAGPFKVVTMEGVKRNDGSTSLYKADGPGLIDEGWDHDPQVAIHRCRAYNNVWNAAKQNQ